MWGRWGSGGIWNVQIQEGCGSSGGIRTGLVIRGTDMCEHSTEPGTYLCALKLTSVLQRKPLDSNCNINSKQANTTFFCIGMEQRCWPRSSLKA